MLEDLSREDLLTAVDRAVADLLAAAGVAAPPVDAVAVAERHLGLTIRQDDRPRSRSSKANDRREIVLSSGLSEEQTQSAVARALGAVMKPEILRILGIPPEERQGLLGSSPAERFAERFLLPTAWFAAEARALDFDVAALHERFGTAGHEAIAARLLDLPEPCVIAVIDDGIVVRRRSNAWRVNRELSPAERECQRHIHEHGLPHVVRSAGWTVNGWPVPRTLGRRVILRGVIDEDAL